MKKAVIGIAITLLVAMSWLLGAYKSSSGRSSRTVEDLARVFYIKEITVDNSRILIQRDDSYKNTKNLLYHNLRLEASKSSSSDEKKIREENFKKTGLAELRVGEELVIPEHEFGFSMKLKSVKKGVAFIEMREDFVSPVDSRDDRHKIDKIKVDKSYSKVKRNSR